ncbi:hypothetical protein EJB05_22993, partial [Eragrostis curvula]
MPNISDALLQTCLVGQAKCADCTRKNMMAEAAFKGLQVVIKCKNGNGEYERKPMSKLDVSGAFAVPLAADLHNSDCFAQLHNVAGLPCHGQEPSSIVPMDDGTFIVVAGKVQFPSDCASATISHDHVKHLSEHFHKDHGHDSFFDHFHKDHDHHHHFFNHFLKPPATPEYHPPTPTYGSPPPIYHSPTQH